MNFGKNNKITLADTTIANGSTDVTDGVIFAMSGFEGIVFIAKISDSANTATIRLQAYGNSASSTSGATLIGSGTLLTDAGGDDLNNQTLVLDVYRPNYDYVYCVVDRGTANTEIIGGITAIQYGAALAPVTHSATSGEEVTVDLIAS